MNNENNPQKKHSVTRRAKSGAYSLAFAAILLAVLIIINLIVYNLPSTYTVFDTSENKMMTITKTTEDFVKDIDRDVTVYFICEQGIADAELETLIKHYSDLNSKINYKVIDPINNPTFTSKYVDYTLNNYSIIVESELRHSVIDRYDLYYVENDYFGRLDYTTFEAYMNSQMASYFTSENTEVFFNAEAVITTAFDYVTADVVPHLYLLSNHGETGLDEEAFLTRMGEANIEYEFWDLLEKGSIPDTCTCLIIGSPKSDISESEASKIIEYLDKGGSLLLLTDPSATEFKNLLSITEHYGVSAKSGKIFEGNASYYPSGSAADRLLLPMNSNHSMVASMLNYGYTTSSNLSLLMPDSHPIQPFEKLPENVTVNSIVSTSDKAYLVDKDGNKIEDSTASYITGISIDKKTDDAESHIIWFSSTKAFTNEVISERSLNQMTILFSLTYTGGMSQFASELASDIQAISQSGTVLSLTATDAIVWGIVVAIVIPAVFLTVGLVIWIKRRKR